MEIMICVKESFAVIGKEGSTVEGSHFIQNLWADANSHFSEVQHIAKKDENGNVVGIWGAMSDFSRAFQPWEDSFQKGLYLAGVECDRCQDPPVGWTKWVIPGYEYIYVENDDPNTFPQVLDYMNKQHIPLVGAVHDFICPHTGKNYLYFPIKAL